ncbi:MAG: DNA repair protein RecN [Verrucomicrobia bacterium]|nr:MAG: DNA repair protein RecN [Verrucomicrobiota bacterium]
MLTTLRVKNLALVERVNADFRPGLNVITGETGTGKSILIGALSLVLGERADKRLIRAGAEACGAEAVFQLTEADAINALLEAAGLEPCADGQLIVRRILKAEGANQIVVNDQPATLQLLKQLGELLVDMHGPYDHQSLLNPAFQLDLLDAFGHIWEARETYEAAYLRWRGIEDRIAQLIHETADPAVEIDRLEFIIKDIEAAAPVAGEEETVAQEQRLLGQAQRVQELCNGAADALAEGETAAFNAVVAGQKAVEELARLTPEAGEWLEQLRGINAQLQDINGGLHNLAEKTEADPQRLDWLDERLATYQRLRKKYAPTVPEILALLVRSKDRLHDLQNRDEQLERLRKESSLALIAVRELGAELTAQRESAGKKLGVVVTKELRALGFVGGIFAVELQPAEPQPAGLDAIDFGFAPNIGEPMHPLRAIASSGEIARVMLAIKCVLAQHDRIPVLIFDEIDANIGGETGNAVGKKLAEVAGNHQVICITHLPQVAAHGQTHLAVTKSVREGRTFTEVKQLDERGRVNELARMLGGRDLTNVTLAHARAMLEKV